MPTRPTSAQLRDSDRLTRLQRLGPEGRMAHYQAGKLTLADRMLWAARYPNEPPTINGELEWIAVSLADLD